MKNNLPKENMSLWILMLIIFAILITVYTTLVLTLGTWLPFYGAVFAGVCIAILWFCEAMMYYVIVLEKKE